MYLSLVELWTNHKTTGFVVTSDFKSVNANFSCSIVSSIDIKGLVVRADTANIKCNQTQSDGSGVTYVMRPSLYGTI
jgi:hypothetical protein